MHLITGKCDIFKNMHIVKQLHVPRQSWLAAEHTDEKKKDAAEQEPKMHSSR